MGKNRSSGSWYVCGSLLIGIIFNFRKAEREGNLDVSEAVGQSDGFLSSSFG